MPPARVDPILTSFASVIKPNSRIIDIGAGPGLLGLAISQQLNAQVTLADVVDYNKTNLPLVVGDSNELEFENNSFDYAILCFVLHHSKTPEKIVSEALRVARHVIVIENDVRGKIRRPITWLVDSLQSPWYGTPPCRVTRTKEEWLKFFGEFGEARVLKEFALEFGFFRCFTVDLRKR